MQPAACVKPFFVICLSVAVSMLPLQAAGRLAGRDNSTALLALLTSSWNCFENMQCSFPGHEEVLVEEEEAKRATMTGPYSKRQSRITYELPAAPPSQKPPQCRTGFQCMSKAGFEETFGGFLPSGYPGSNLAADAYLEGRQPCTHKGMEGAIGMFKKYEELEVKIKRKREKGKDTAEYEKKLEAVRTELYDKVKTKFFDLGCVCCKAMTRAKPTETAAAPSTTSPSKASSFKPPAKKQSRMDPSFEFILDNIPGLGSNAKKLIKNL
ncbi:unnamed protein product [Vitrella brassicaformis CCMP3155]|uniref:Uncharacterized protein n=1 Tax=Vitrella brassicaformis (strain CCMP3155) TaxID=1169540 RepID=A0A0G4EAX6_VITBC|nr:unnamed protein product [Vitrella brassicaformis CCMP3155]|eukprot:CEL92603.1 unnamed protein product [Vitrella brassicaformis CCMP3155]